MAPDATWLGQLPKEVMGLEGSVLWVVIFLWRGSSNALGPGVFPYGVSAKIAGMERVLISF